MRKSCVIALSIMALCGMANAITIPIDLNDFYADSTVTVSADGTNAFFVESNTFMESILSNDPGVGDPEVIIASPLATLLFDYEFNESEFGDDEFGAWIIDPATGFGLAGYEFFTSSSSSGTISFDISSLAGMTGLGLQFQLSSSPYDDATYASTAEVSNVRIEVIPEPSTMLALLAMGSAFAVNRFRRSRAR